MAVTVENSGTQTASINTEHSLHTDADAKVFQSFVDLSNMASGDILQVYVYVMPKGSSTRRLAFFAEYYDAPTEKVAVSPPVASAFSYELAIKQTAGTGRNFDWSVVSV